MSNVNKKKQAKNNENKELQQKQNEAEKKYQEGRKIMNKEIKAQADYDKAIQCYTEAIGLLPPSQLNKAEERLNAKYYSSRGNIYLQLGQY